MIERLNDSVQFMMFSSYVVDVCSIFHSISVTGFYGYLSLGDEVKDTATLNLPLTPSVFESCPFSFHRFYHLSLVIDYVYALMLGD